MLKRNLLRSFVIKFYKIIENNKKDGIMSLYNNEFQILIYRGVILLVSLVVILFTSEQWYCSIHLAVVLYSPLKSTRGANTTWRKPNTTAKQYHSP